MCRHSGPPRTLQTPTSSCQESLLATAVEEKITGAPHRNQDGDQCRPGGTCSLQAFHAQVGQRCPMSQQRLTCGIASFTRARSASHSEVYVQQQPLTPCIINHQPASPRHRRSRTESCSPAQTRVDAATVPLRPCCANCTHVMEACLEEGDAWQVHFTQGAQRLRTARAGCSSKIFAPRARVCETTAGFDAVVAVDETDKKRLSLEVPCRPLNEVGLMPSLSRVPSEGARAELDEEEDGRAAAAIALGQWHARCPSPRPDRRGDGCSDGGSPWGCARLRAAAEGRGGRTGAAAGGARAGGRAAAPAGGVGTVGLAYIGQPWRARNKGS